MIVLYVNISSKSSLCLATEWYVLMKHPPKYVRFFICKFVVFLVKTAPNYCRYDMWSETSRRRPDTRYTAPLGRWRVDLVRCKPYTHSYTWVAAQQQYCRINRTACCCDVVDFRLVFPDFSTCFDGVLCRCGGRQIKHLPVACR